MTHARITHYPAPACPRLPPPAPACPRLPPPAPAYSPLRPLPVYMYLYLPCGLPCNLKKKNLPPHLLFFFHPIKASHGRGPGNGNVDEIVRNIATWRTTNGEEMHGYLWQVSLREIPFPA